MPFSRGSFQPRNPTEALCTAGGLFTTKLPWKFFGYCHCSVTQLCPTLWTPWTTAHQASLFFTISQSLFKLMSVESALHIRWPKYWSFSFSISPSNDYSGFISFRIDWFDLLAVQETLKNLLNSTVRRHLFFGAQPFLSSNSHICTQLLKNHNFD